MAKKSKTPRLLKLKKIQQFPFGVLVLVAAMGGFFGYFVIYSSFAQEPFATYGINLSEPGLSARGRIVNEPNLVTGKAWETNPRFNQGRENKPAYISQRFRLTNSTRVVCAPIKFLTPNTRVKLSLYKGNGSWISSAIYPNSSYYDSAPTKYSCLSNNFGGDSQPIPNSAVLKINIIRGKARIGNTYLTSWDYNSNLDCGIRMIGNPNYDRLTQGCSTTSSQKPTSITETEALSVAEDAPAE